MAAHLTPDEHRDAVRAAMDALDHLPADLHQVRGDELAELVSLCDGLVARATHARTQVVAEAVRRGEVDSTLPAWVREHAPSLQQGGAAQTARLVMEATKGGPTWTADDVTLDPDSPVGLVWAAATERALTPPNALAVLSEVRSMTPRLVAEAVPTVTRALIDLCLEWGPAHMRRLRPRLVAEFGETGEIEDLHAALGRTAHLSSPHVESGRLTEYRLGLTPAQAAVLEATIGPLSAPAPNAETGERDLRPAGQRRAEALIEVCQSAAAEAMESGGQGPSGAYAGLHVTMSLPQLRRLTGCRAALPGSAMSVPAEPDASSDDLLDGEVLGTPAAGVVLSPETLRLIACHADLIPQVLGSEGECLDQGREIRLFNRAQRRRLLRRDQHCTYPGCDRPGAWCRAHHVQHWLDHGSSDLDNAALLCERHHSIVHSRRLWASVGRGPDEHGRHVVWDLSDGSYDRELARQRAERASLDPPPPMALDLLRGLIADHGPGVVDDRDLPWTHVYEPPGGWPDEFFTEVRPRWDEQAQTFVDVA